MRPRGSPAFASSTGPPPPPSRPLVASPGIGRDAAQRLSEAFVAMADAPSMRPVLDLLLLNGFVAVDAAAYDITRQRADGVT